MTQKSHARKLRDAKEKQVKAHLNENNAWDDLNATYSECAGLLRQHAMLGALSKKKELHPFVPNFKMLVANLETVAADLLVMSNELTQIRDMHKDRKGRAVNPDEVIETIQIFEHYHLFMTRHQGVIMPLVSDILDAFNAAELGLQAALQKQAQAEASDPAHTDPIDVSFTETTPTAATEAETIADTANGQEQ